MMGLLELIRGGCDRSRRELKFGTYENVHGTNTFFNRVKISGKDQCFLRNQKRFNNQYHQIGVSFALNLDFTGTDDPSMP
jgi:hypothetical protein